MLRSLTTRRMLPVVALLTVSLSLTGCGGGSKKKDDSAATKTRDSGCGFKAGAVSDAVTIAGDFGKAVTAKFKSPLKATSLQRTVVTQGTGVKPASGDVLDVALTLYNGATGKLIDQGSQQFTVGDTTVQKDIQAAFDCVNLGSRVASTFPAKDILGPTGNAQAGIGADDTLVVVADVVDKYVAPMPAGWASAPKVTFHGAKSPSVTLPAGDPSPDLLLHVIKAGHGAKVASGDTVTLNYKGITWGTGDVFDQSYGKKPLSLATTSFVPGFGAALVGQKVGTQLIVSIPPRYGYGEIGSSPLAGKTLVFVVEIQGSKSAKK